MGSGELYFYSPIPKQLEAFLDGNWWYGSSYDCDLDEYIPLVVDVEVEFDQGYSDGYPANGESDWEMQLSHVRTERQILIKQLAQLAYPNEQGSWVVNLQDILDMEKP